VKILQKFILFTRETKFTSKRQLLANKSEILSTQLKAILIDEKYLLSKNGFKYLIAFPIFNATEFSSFSHFGIADQPREYVSFPSCPTSSGASENDVDPRWLYALT
jgi:hypothetical protein